MNTIFRAKNEDQPHNRNRSGVALLLVIVCMIVITAILGAMLRHLALASRQMKQQMHHIQATWLAESAIERAVFAIRHGADYSEEVWKVTAKELEGRHAGQVSIRVRGNDEDGSLAVDVWAIYPHPSAFGVKVRKQIVVAHANVPHEYQGPEK